MEVVLDSPWEDEVFPALAVASSSSSLGQVMSSILSTRPRRLKAAIADLGLSPSKSASGALLDESLCFLWRNMEDAAQREEPLDHVLVPLIERFKDPKYRKQVFILIKWLFRNELLLQTILISLKEIISTKSNHFTAFAWCTFVTTLVQLSPNRLFQGEKEHHHPTVLRILCGSIPRLLIIAREGSTMVEGFELPTRLAVAAADCIILLTELLAKGESLSSKTSSDSEKLLTKSKKRNALIKILSNSDEKLSNQTQATEISDDIGAEFLLWSYLNDLIILVEKLEAWSKKSLPLREKGLKQVREWLMEIKEYHSFARDEAGGKSLMNGVLLLSSCWKHYGMLLRFETRKYSQNLCQVFDQYLSALEFYTQHDAERDPVKLKSSLDTRKFFLNCIALLWGRLSAEERKMATSETGINLITGLLTQLKCGREDLVEISVTIMKTVIFANTSQFQDILSVLLSLLEERNSASKAVIELMAEFCYTDGSGITEMIKLLASGSHNQRKNAIDVIVEVVCGHPDAGNKVSPDSWQIIARHLLECLGDEELVDHVLESNLFPYLDPCFLVPRFVHLCFLGNEKVSSSSTSALTSVLSQHNDKFSVIEKLLDSLSEVSSDRDSSMEKGMSEKYVEEKSSMSRSGSKLGIDHVLKLTPVWMESVKHIHRLIDQLINKIFSDPSNPVLFRFMSYAGERLTEAGDSILHRVLVYMQSQELDESWASNRSKESFERENEIGSKITVFSRLCPLLILRLLPLKIFDNLESSKLYGMFSDDKILTARANATDSINRDCITDELVARALGLCEYEDVRKVAAELCGRLHPRFLIPTLAYHMKSASEHRNALKMKACLFALCTSLVSRGVESASHPLMSQIRLTIDSILSRPSFDPDEVPKVQHGCIDCTALMICAEVQSTHPGSGAADHSVLTSVVQRLVSEPGSSAMNRVRLCMASALVSAIQKVGSSGQSALAHRTLSSLIPSFQLIADFEIRIACLQVLYSAVYHLKSSVLPYSTDLLDLSLKSLKKGTDKEKITAAKLLASLMASEDEIVERISPGLVKAKSTLMRISMAGSSSGELTEMCEKLLSCLTFPL